MKVVVEVGEGSMTHRVELPIGEEYDFGDSHYYFTIVGARNVEDRPAHCYGCTDPNCVGRL